jgi:hypothetical protein
MEIVLLFYNFSILSFGKKKKRKEIKRGLCNNIANFMPVCSQNILMQNEMVLGSQNSRGRESWY